MNCCNYDCHQGRDCPARATVAPIKCSRPRFETKNSGAHIDTTAENSYDRPWPAIALAVAVAVGAVAAAALQAWR